MVADSIQIINDTAIEVSCELDLEDLENENDEQSELDSFEQIVQLPQTISLELKRTKTSILGLLLKTRIQYLDFTTPPPEAIV